MTRSHEITEFLVLQPKKCNKKKPNLPQEGTKEIPLENDAEKIEKIIEMQKATEGLCHNPRIVGSGLTFFTNSSGERSFYSNPPTNYQFDPCTHEGACENFHIKDFILLNKKRNLQRIQFTL